MYYNARVCIPNVENYRLNVMHDLHEIPIASHPRFLKPYMTIKRHYYLPSMKKYLGVY